VRALARYQRKIKGQTEMNLDFQGALKSMSQTQWLIVALLIVATFIIARKV
jgi:hypothetical protein